jgi:uncharacterized membrane protein YqhA
MMLFIDFWTRLMQTNLVIGLILAILGLSVILLSKRIVKSYKKVDEVKNDDHTLMVLRGFGLVLILIAMFIMILY